MPEQWIFMYNSVFIASFYLLLCFISGIWHCISCFIHGIRCCINVLWGIDDWIDWNALMSLCRDGWVGTWEKTDCGWCHWRHSFKAGGPAGAWNGHQCHCRWNELLIKTSARSQSAQTCMNRFSLSLAVLIRMSWQHSAYASDWQLKHLYDKLLFC